MVAYHRTRLVNAVETPLLFLPHWSLWEALAVSPFSAHRLGLLHGESLARERVQHLLVSRGVTVREAKGPWGELPAGRRQEVVAGLSGTGYPGTTLGRGLVFPSVRKHTGYSTGYGAGDVARAALGVVANAGEGDNQVTGEEGAGRGNPQGGSAARRVAFFQAVELMKAERATVTRTHVAQCAAFYKDLAQTATRLLQRGEMKSTKTFSYVLLQEEDLPVHYLNPSTLRCLGQYLTNELVSRNRKQSRARRSGREAPQKRQREKEKLLENSPARDCLVLGALNSATAQYLFVAVEPHVVDEHFSDPRSSISRDPELASFRTQQGSVLSQEFEKLAQTFPNVVCYRGLEKDWILVHRDHGLHVLEAIHVEMLKMITANRK